MKAALSTNLGASVRARLLNLAKVQGRDFNQVLTRYALERLLYRLSISEYSQQFLLKGAMLFDLWFDVAHRPTRDLDLLGLQDFDGAELRELTHIFQALCRIDCDDGMHFDPHSVKAETTREPSSYAGVRVVMVGVLDRASCAIQIDIGFGDAVTPDAEEANYPTLLSELPSPTLRIYPRYSVVAEKLDAIITLGIANSRMKDYFDLWMLHEKTSFDSVLLQQAIHATLKRRSTKIPIALPIGLSDAFAEDAVKVQQWSAFLKKNKLQAIPLAALVQQLRQWLWSPLCNTPTNT